MVASAFPAPWTQIAYLLICVETLVCLFVCFFVRPVDLLLYFWRKSFKRLLLDKDVLTVTMVTTVVASFARSVTLEPFNSQRSIIRWQYILSTNCSSHSLMSRQLQVGLVLKAPCCDGVMWSSS